MSRETLLPGAQRESLTRQRPHWHSHPGLPDCRTLRSEFPLLKSLSGHFVSAAEQTDASCLRQKVADQVLMVPRRSLCQRRVVKVPREVVLAWADRLDAGWRQGALALGRGTPDLSSQAECTCRCETRLPTSGPCGAGLAGSVFPDAVWLFEPSLTVGVFLKLDVRDNLSCSLGRTLSAFVLVAT